MDRDVDADRYGADYGSEQRYSQPSVNFSVCSL